MESNEYIDPNAEIESIRSVNLDLSFGPVLLNSNNELTTASTQASSLSSVVTSPAPDPSAMSERERIDLRSQLPTVETGLRLFRSYLSSRMDDANTHNFTLLMCTPRNREIPTVMDVIKGLDEIGFHWTNPADVEKVILLQNRLSWRYSQSIQFKMHAGATSSKLHDFLNSPDYVDKMDHINGLVHAQQFDRYQFLWRETGSGGASIAGLIFTCWVLYRRKYPSSKVLYGVDRLLVTDGQRQLTELSLCNLVESEKQLVKEAQTFTSSKGKSYIRLILEEYGMGAFDYS